MTGISRPKLLDLGCGAGGAAMGYSAAGFEVSGVDIADQPHYPFTFWKGDMVGVLNSLILQPWKWPSFDAIHVSAPCQLWATATRGQRSRGYEYPDLITPVRPLLERTGVPWVMENVPEAPLRNDLELCGCHFGLVLDDVGYLKRLRRFELSWQPRMDPLPHHHAGPAISICGHGTPAWQRRLTGHVPVARWREVMRIGWMNRDELTEAIPPVYTQMVGGLLMGQVLRG